MEAQTYNIMATYTMCKAIIQCNIWFVNISYCERGVGTMKADMEEGWKKQAFSE